MAGTSTTTGARIRRGWGRAGATGAIAALTLLLTPGTASAAGEVTPVLNCTKPAATGSGFTAILGYNNVTDQEITIPFGMQNRFVSSRFDGHQPTVFQPGRHDGVFSVTITAPSATWTLGDTPMLIKPSEAPACSADTQLPADGNGTGAAVALGVAGVVGAAVVHRARRRAIAATANGITASARGTAGDDA